MRQARLAGREGLWDIGVEGNRIAAVEPRLDRRGAAELDAQGTLVAPGFVNPHLHLDKCLLGDVMRPNLSQTLQEAIVITWDHKRRYTADEIGARADAVLQAALDNGTIVVRAFADVDPIGGLVPVEALVAARDRWRDRGVRVQVCAFPQEGIIRQPGTDRLMEEAMDRGADVVGGLPWYERSDEAMRAHVDFCFRLARRHDKDIHMLADDTDDPTSRSLEYLALRTLEEGYAGRVSASHCGALAAYDHAHAERVVALVAEAGVSICSNPHISLVMDGHTDRGLVRRGITRVRELLSAGVNVCSGQDDVNDPYYPFGQPDQLEVAFFMAHVAHLTYPGDLETCFAMVTANAARALRLPDYGLKVGGLADLVGLGTPTIREALRWRPPRPFVVSGGRIVARARVERQRF